jgi:SAM-dependent methyltransferase
MTPMSRISTRPDDPDKPRIDRDEVASFFERRSEKIGTLGPVRAVIYQDKHPDLAERRDAAEKERIGPLLALDGTQRLLDVGCGTGRWADVVAPRVAHYHGIDISEGLVAFARDAFRACGHCRFSVAPVDAFSLASLREDASFDRILCAGVLIYLNDDDVTNALRCLEAASASTSRIVLREPIGVSERLTIKDHFSTDLDQTYNAIYRTQAELEAMMKPVLFDRGFRLADSGDVFASDGLNNRAETRQRWMLLERGA